jgi:hypothetical protein
MSITYPGPKGHLRVVRLWGADNIDGLRGIALSGVSLDEFSQLEPTSPNSVQSRILESPSDALRSILSRP